MKYANTAMLDGVERVITVLPLDAVPGFDPQNPPQSNTYGVADDVQVGWVKQTDGSFAPYAGTPVPLVVSFFQGCAALQAGGYLDPVEAYMTGPATAVEKLAWRTITEIRRTSPLTAKLAVMLGLTEAQVDDLFILAATIEA